MGFNELLPENPNFLPLLLKNSPVVIYTTDEEGIIQYISPAFERITGLKVEDFIGKSYIEIIHPKDLTIVERAKENLKKGAPVETFQIRVRTKSGDYKIGEFTVMPFLSQGKIIGRLGIARDITKRKMVEIALEESEKKYRELFENIPIGIYRTTPKGEILLANTAMVNMLGFSSLDDLLKLDLEKNGYHPDFPRSIFKKIMEEKGEVKNFEAKWLKKDGSTIYIRENAKAIKDEKGNIIYYEGTVEDITKEKETEEKLFKKTKELQAVFSVLPDLFFKINKDGVFIDYIAGEIKDLYLPPKDFLGKSFKDIFPPQLADLFMNQLKNSLEKNKMEVVEYELTIEGEKKFFESRIIPFSSDQVVAVVRNITSKKIWEKALKESEARFRSISENALAGVYIIQDDKFLYANPAFCEIFGYTIDEIVGKLGPIDLTFEGDKERIKLELKERINGTKTKEVSKFKGVKKNGEIICLESYSVKTEILDKPAIMGIIIDITEREKTENTLKEYTNTLKKLLDGIVSTMSKIVEIKDPYTAGHQQRVAELALMIGQEMGLSKEKLEAIYVAAMIHDIGKIHIPAEILTKPGELSPLEREMIQSHPHFGYEILKNIEFPWPIAQIVLQHHEKIDGTGYPLHLKGDQILLEAKILSVADVVEAMSTHRPYRAGYGLARALDEIINYCGKWYDEDVVHACLKLLKDKDIEFKYKI